MSGESIDTPDAGQPTANRPAPLPKRTMAYLIDFIVDCYVLPIACAFGVGLVKKAMGIPPSVVPGAGPAYMPDPGFSEAGTTVFWVLYPVYYIFFTCAFGGTMGKLLCRIRVVNMAGRRLNVWRAGIRFVFRHGYFFLVLIYAAAIGWIFPFRHMYQHNPFPLVGLLIGSAYYFLDVHYATTRADTRALHDLAAGSMVVF